MTRPNKVFDQIKDKDGHYTGLFSFAFSTVTATKLGDDAPVEAKDFLKARIDLYVGDVKGVNPYSA